MTRRKILLTRARGFVIAALAASIAGHRLAIAIGPDGPRHGRYDLLSFAPDAARPSCR
jgi:hypothetical protein